MPAVWKIMPRRERGFLNGADALLLRPGGKNVLEEGNDSFGSFGQNPGFVRSACGSGRAVLPQDCFRQAQEPRRLGWFVGFDQKAVFLCHVNPHS